MGDGDADPKEANKDPQPGEQLNLLIEIVSCWDLIVGDFKTSDPYVKVQMGGDDVHETKHIPKTLDPVFTVKHDSFFRLSVPAKELFDKNGLVFKVKDYDRLALKNDELGSVQVPPQILYAATGERLEFKLDPPSGKKGKDAGYIAVRCRIANEHDETFLDSIKNENDTKELLGLYNYRSIAVRKPSKRLGSSVMRGNSKVEKSGPEKGIKKCRIRPRPDPEREEDTMWMTEEQVEAEAMKKTRKWIDIGSGDLGRVFLEIIGADDLCNKDSGIGLFGQNKSDAFVSVVFEDAMAKTDVIDDCLSPRWLPWMQRAFIFRMMNTSSNLLVGVFDCDQGVANDHDLIGRISIVLSNFRPDTEYLLQYHLHETPNRSDRTTKGTLTVRLRIELEDERRALLSSLRTPPVVYVNVRDKDDFRVVRKTCGGKYDTEAYSTKTINAYVEELRTYKYMMYHIKDSIINLIFWRGHFPLRFRVPGRSALKPGSEEETRLIDRFTKQVTLFLPLHSINSFIAAVMLVERPALAPSFFFLSVAWLLLAVMGYRRRSPNPWRRCKSFGEFIQVLIFGEYSTPPPSIAQHENEEEAQAFEEKWRKRIAEAEEAAARKNEKRLKDLEEHEKLMEEIGETCVDTDLSTKTDGGPSLDPLKPILYPIQKYLAVVCDGARFTRNVVCWEECYFSFWLATGSLVLGLVFFFVPWAFIIRWVSRIVAWTLFGPWMKLVDIFWYKKLKGPTEEELKLKDEAKKKAKIEAAKASAAEARVKREEAKKMEDMRRVIYGEYMTQVPIIDLNRYVDVPIHTSMAKPCEQSLSDDVVESERVAGQWLVGHMIPKLKDSISVSLTKVEGKIARASDHSRFMIVSIAIAALAIFAWFAAPSIAPSFASMNLSCPSMLHLGKNSLYNHRTIDSLDAPVNISADTTQMHFVEVESTEQRAKEVGAKSAKHGKTDETAAGAKSTPKDDFAKNPKELAKISADTTQMHFVEVESTEQRAKEVGAKSAKHGKTDETAASAESTPKDDFAKNPKELAKQEKERARIEKRQKKEAEKERRRRERAAAAKEKKGWFRAK